MRLDISIREKLVVYYVSLGILSIILVGIYSFSSARKAIVERSFNQLTSIREVKKERLQRFIQDRKRDIHLLSNDKVTFDLLSYMSHPDIEKKTDEANKQYFKDFFGSGEYYSKLVVVDDESYIDYSYLDTIKKSSNYIFPKTQNSVYSSLYKKIKDANTIILTDYILLDTIYTLLLGAPITDKHTNAFVGALILGVPVNPINEIMFEDNSVTGLGESGESYLVGSDFFMRSQSRFKNRSVLATTVKTSAVIQALEKNAGTQVIEDYRNISVLSSYSDLDIEGLNWVILAEIDFKEIMTPIYKIRNDIILISSFISMTLFFVAFLISKRITDPLIRLNKAAIDIAFGNYGARLPVEANDEIGDLTQSFNTMSFQIKEQTKELKERERRLNHFYEATKDGIILHDRGRPILVNQRICKLSGYTERELKELMLGDIISITDSDKYRSHPDRSFTYETVCFKKDGSHFHVEVQENPIEYEGNIISSTIIRDITERICSEEEIKKERQKRLTSFIDGQEEERRRLSRELHDGLGQILIGIKMRLESIRFTSVEKDKETVDFLKDITNQTINDVRRMSNNLMPSVLRELGLVMAINQLCKQVKQNPGIDVKFESENVQKFEDDRIKTYVYRVIQEAVNNATKHGNATIIRVILIQEELYLRLIVEDNGCGFDMKTLQADGNGLHNMRERIHLLNGNINISSNPGEGTVINAKIPLNNITNGKN